MAVVIQWNHLIDMLPGNTSTIILTEKQEKDLNIMVPKSVFYLGLFNEWLQISYIYSPTFFYRISRTDGKIHVTQLQLTSNLVS